jgi:ADP-L-glycero-D-manno-heptose 6-epimerase
MKILITGYKGFIGKNIIPALSDHQLSFYEWGEPTPTIKGRDLVIHLGAISSTTETNVEKVMRQNYDFSILLLSECIKHGVDLQYSSSASVYGSGREFKEDSPMGPGSPYAWSKYLFDRHITKLLKTQHNLPVIHGFRYFNVFGPGEEHKGDQASPQHKFEQQAKNTGVIKLFENSGNYRRDFVPVQTVIDVHKKFFSIRESGIWNVGTGIATSFQEVAENIAKKYNAQIEYIPMPDSVKGQYQTYTRADITKLTNTLNNSPHSVIKLAV